MSIKIYIIGFLLSIIIHTSFSFRSHHIPSIRSQCLIRTSHEDDHILTVVKSKSKEIVDTAETTKAFFLLNTVAVIWGSQHAIIKSTLDTFPTSSLNFWRFLSSAALFSPALLNVLQNKDMDDSKEKDRVIRGGLELGVYTFMGFAFQSIGLETTTASRSAFLLYLNVKFVPFLAALLYKREIPISVWASASLALTGTYLLSTDGNSALNIGDAWCIAAALASAMFILRLESISRDGVKAGQLNSVSSATVALLCSVWVSGDVLGDGKSLVDVRESILGPLLANPWPPLFLGVITTSLCGWLQIQGQRVIPAERASIIYSLDPLYGAAFSSYLLDEKFGAKGLLGGLFILAGVVLSGLSAPKTKQVQEEAEVEVAKT